MNCHVDEQGWIRCPVCGGKTRTKVLSSTVLSDFPLYCPKCHQTNLINYQSEGASRKQEQPQTK